MHFMAQAVMTPSGVPPTPIMMSTELVLCAAATAPATSPSPMRRIFAPDSRMSRIRSAWRGRSSTITVTSSLRRPLALATALMLCSTGASMSMVPAASGPTAILSM